MAPVTVLGDPVDDAHGQVPMIFVWKVTFEEEFG